jgi:hypothetical protein
VRAKPVGLDGVVPEIAKRCCYQVRICATSMEALLIASVAPVAVSAGCVLQPLKVSSVYRPVLGSLVGLLYRATRVLVPSCRVVAGAVGLLSEAATGHGPGCHAANMSNAICVGFLRGPLNFGVGSAIEDATVVVAGWVAWRRVCNAGKVDPSAQLESRVAIVAAVWTTKGAVGKRLGSRMGDVSDWTVESTLRVCGDVLACAQSRRTYSVVVPNFNRFGVDESGVSEVCF